MALSEPSALYGSPTTMRSGCHSRSSESTALHDGPAAVLATAASGLALRRSVLPHATPMRRRPKSNARTSCGERRLAPSGAAGASARLLGIAADRADAG